MDQKLVPMMIGEGLPQLLGDPELGRMLRNVETQNPPAVVGNREEAIEHSKPESRDREEVHRGDNFTMVLQKCLPTLGWLRIPRRPSYPARCRPFREIESQWPLRSHSTPAIASVPNQPTPLIRSSTSSVTTWAAPSPVCRGSTAACPSPIVELRQI